MMALYLPPLMTRWGAGVPMKKQKSRSRIHQNMGSDFSGLLQSD